MTVLGLGVSVPVFCPKRCVQGSKHALTCGTRCSCCHGRRHGITHTASHAQRHTHSLTHTPPLSLPRSRRPWLSRALPQRRRPSSTRGRAPSPSTTSKRPSRPSTRQPGEGRVSGNRQCCRACDGMRAGAAGRPSPVLHGSKGYAVIGNRYLPWQRGEQQSSSALPAPAVSNRLSRGPAAGAT